jgi:hypothetical protein
VCVDLCKNSDFNPNPNPIPTMVNDIFPLYG